MALMTSTGVSSGLGLAFWVVAAHLVHPAEVGRASAEVAAMTLLATVSQLNLVNVYTRFLPRSGVRARRFVIVGYATCFTIGLASSSVFFLLGSGHNILHPGVWEALLFIGSVGLWTVFVLQDSVLTGLRSAKWVPVENSAFAAGKLLLLVPFASLGASGVFLAWALPVVPAVAGVNLYLFIRRIPSYNLETGGRSEFPSLRTLRNFVVAEYVSSLVAGFGGYLLPIVVVASLGAKAGAYFYVPWLVGTVTEILLWNVSTSFVVEAGYQREALKTLLHDASRLALWVLLPVAAALIAGAPWLLSVLGTGYRVQGSTLLRLIGVSLLPMAVTVLYQTFVWYEGRLWRLVVVQSSRIGLFFALSLSLLTHIGINAAGVGMLASQGFTAVLVLPSTIKRWRSYSSSQT